MPGDDWLTLGYGSGGATARYFELADEASVGVGYVKLFLSTAHVDYHWMARGSPFDSGRDICEDDGSDVLCWDTKCISIIQRKVMEG